MRTKLRDYLTRGLLVAMATIALIFVANARPAQAGGPPAEPTPLPLVGLGTTTTSVTVAINTRPDAEYFAQVDCIVMEGPGFGQTVSSLPQGNGVYVSLWTSDGVWAKINDGSVELGWTLAKNLSDHPPVTVAASGTCTGSCGTVVAAPAVAPTITTGGSTATMCVTSRGLNQRPGPGTSFVTTWPALARGDEVRLTGTFASNSWVQGVTPSGHTAWVAGWLLGACSAPAPATASSPADGEVTWSSQNDWTVTRGDLPAGNRTAWAVIQAWNGVDATTTVHLVVAPNMVVRIPAGWQGAMWEVWGPEAPILARAREMAGEVASRDGIDTPPLLIVRRVGDPANGWTVQPFGG